MMPFECAVDGTRIVLKPSEPRGYAIRGGRDERQVTACAASGANDCRTVIAHRFQITCGGRRVPWMRVVAAASASAPREIWIDAGRLHLALDRRDAGGGCRSSSRTLARRGGADDVRSSRAGLPPAECLPWDRKAVPHIVLPQGFAPLVDIGARILIGVQTAAVDVSQSIAGAATGENTRTSIAVTSPPPAPPPQQLAEQAAASAAAAQDPPGKVTQARLVPAEAVARPPETTSIPAVMTAADVSRSWVTQVRPEPGASDHGRGVRFPTYALWLVAIMLAAVAAMFAVTRWRPRRVAMATARAGLGVETSARAGSSGSGAADPTAGGPSDPASRPSGSGQGPASGGSAAGFGHELREALRKATAGFGGSGAASPRPVETTSLANAAASVTALIDQANGSLGLLSGAPPLREVLEQEIGLIQQRLAIVKAQASDSPEAAHKAAPAFRSLVRDLERVRRISESAALSFSADHNSIRLPRTKSEAYEVLGINADIGEATLKKLVDALRVCWHPDLAKDKADLAQREERIKVINVAWDLIVGKRDAS